MTEDSQAPKDTANISDLKPEVNNESLLPNGSVTEFQHDQATGKMHDPSDMVDEDDSE